MIPRKQRLESGDSDAITVRQNGSREIGNSYLSSMDTPGMPKPMTAT